MPTLNFSSFPALETERLILRSHSLDDANALFALRTHEEVMRYINRENPKNIKETEARIRQIHEGYNNKISVAWVIALKENPKEMIGEIGFYRTDLANYRAEVGYMLHPLFWRNKIISEALNKVISFGFEEMKLHSICATINPGNNASRQILLKHGFGKEAYFKEDYYFQGEFLDTEIYGLLNRNWNNNTF
ncbi:MAG: N-acetyltransferase [Pedobacter sp.]|nr:MAG: N-acetyltransferase [Pedobacter sp.]